MPSVLRKAPYHSFSILYSIIYISTTTGRYLGYTVSILRVPSDTKRRALLLPVPARSDIGSYGTTGTSLMRRTRSITSPRAPAFIPICPRCRCRGNRHGPQLAAPARLIERPVRSPWGSVARSLSRTCFRDKYPPYGSSFPFVLCFTLPQMPPKSRAEANAARAARAAARTGRLPDPVPPPAASEDAPIEACSPPLRPAPSTPGAAATPEPVASVVSPDDLSGFPPCRGLR